MNFFSIEFSLLFLCFLAIYWSLKNYKHQNLLILAFNYTLITALGNFYIALVLLFYTIFIHFSALAIASYQKRFLFLGSIAFAVLFLCFFKYYSSIKDFAIVFFSFMGFKDSQIDILMPFGISFYTFASITYLKWVYDGKIQGSAFNKNLQSFEDLATYLSFFPTFISGPIMRADFFFGQFEKIRVWKPENVNLIFMLLIFGIIKKIIIASYLDIYVTEILKNPSSFNMIELLLGIYGYSIQIYCDFSGYVNLVCAFALMIGFKLPMNFNMPYIAKNLKDFWARWHISLSTFIRDYIYIPLGGNKKGFFKTQLFVLISFCISGIWHGNTINFLVWGGLHGMGVIVVNCMQKFSINFHKIPLLSKLITFNFVTFCWIFFYYQDFSQSLDFIYAFNNHLPITQTNIILLLAGFIIFVAYQFCINLDKLFVLHLGKIPNIIKPLYLIILLAVIFSIMPNGIPNFIYADF
ncbi:MULTISPECIES: MBOAT family O-acyltransferase [unclassified Helicobacter]|uniref:MBOAT family O-acyltransferase n=1 Tax=unclassified Helicobacter TaxID=2593540 RepID=UPI000CF0FEB3|nr:MULTISPECIES: MBOAT family O-acyltransferase [unclassified Helicobacter]